MTHLTLFGNLTSKKNGKFGFTSKKTGKNVVIAKPLSEICDAIMTAELYKMENKRIWDDMKRNSNMYKTTGQFYPLFVEFTVYRGTLHRFDYCNIIQGLEDCLVDTKYLEDDSSKCLKPSFGDWKLDRKNPRVELRIIN